MERAQSVFLQMHWIITEQVTSGPITLSKRHVVREQHVHTSGTSLLRGTQDLAPSQLLRLQHSTAIDISRWSYTVLLGKRFARHQVSFPHQDPPGLKQQLCRTRAERHWLISLWSLFKTLVGLDCGSSGWMCKSRDLTETCPSTTSDGACNSRHESSVISCTRYHHGLFHTQPRMYTMSLHLGSILMMRQQ